MNYFVFPCIFRKCISLYIYFIYPSVLFPGLFCVLFVCVLYAFQVSNTSGLRWETGGDSWFGVVSCRCVARFFFMFVLTQSIVSAERLVYLEDS